MNIDGGEEGSLCSGSRKRDREELSPQELDATSKICDLKGKGEGKEEGKGEGKGEGKDPLKEVLASLQTSLHQACGLDSIPTCPELLETVVDSWIPYLEYLSR